MTGAKRKSRSSLATQLSLAPYSLWAALFILVPLVFVAYYAFTDSEMRFTFDNIVSFFNTPEYMIIFWRSMKLAVISTLVCLLIGYPIAYIIARAAPRTQKTIITLIMIPMWMNFLLRTYAWMTILQDTGLLGSLLASIGLSRSHIFRTGTEAAVVIGMVYDYLPYMILPIYSIMAKMDDRLIEAAHDLGCNNVSTLRRVVFPLSLPGVISGVTMVLIPSVSTFYISQKLGNGMFFLIGDAIEEQHVRNNLHFAAAIAFILMIILLIFMALIRRYTDSRVQGGV